MHLGLSSFAYAWAIGVLDRLPIVPLTIPDLLQEASRYDLKRLQVADNLPVHELSKEEWQRLLSSASESGIRLELGARGLRPSHLKRYLKLATDCRSPFLRFVIDDRDFTPGLPEIRDIIKDALPLLKQNRIVLAIENHDRFEARHLAKIIESTDADWVGICLDTANSLGAGEGIKEVTSILGPYTVNLHIKDFQVTRLPHQMGFSVTGRPAGAGQIPIQWLLERLAGYGKCQSATLEVWSDPLPTIEATVARERDWVATSISNLKALYNWA